MAGYGSRLRLIKRRLDMVRIEKQYYDVGKLEQYRERIGAILDELSDIAEDIRDMIKQEGGFSDLNEAVMFIERAMVELARARLKIKNVLE